MFTTTEVFFYILVPVWLLGFAMFYFVRRRNAGQRLRTEAPRGYNREYLLLRRQILEASPKKMGRRESEDSPLHSEAWAVVMDWHVERGIATVVAVADGTASVYFSSGGGRIGGGQGHAEIGSTAQRAVLIAGEFTGQMSATKTFPLPEREQMIFYVVTRKGVLTATVSVESMRKRTNALSKLNEVMQEIVTAYRVLDERRAAGR